MSHWAALTAVPVYITAPVLTGRVMSSLSLCHLLPMSPPPTSADHKSDPFFYEFGCCFFFFSFIDSAYETVQYLSSSDWLISLDRRPLRAFRLQWWDFLFYGAVLHCVCG